jgi:hypothetical protein
VGPSGPVSPAGPVAPVAPAAPLPPPPPPIITMVVSAREGSDPCTDKSTVTGSVVPLVTVRSICRKTVVSPNVYPVGTTSGTCSCTKVALKGMTKDADVPKIRGVGGLGDRPPP